MEKDVCKIVGIKRLQPQGSNKNQGKPRSKKIVYAFDQNTELKGSVVQDPGGSGVQDPGGSGVQDSGGSAVQDSGGSAVQDPDGSVVQDPSDRKENDSNGQDFRLVVLNEDKQKSEMEKQEVVYILEDEDLDDDDVEEAHPKQKDGANNVEDCSADDTMVYMVDGDKVVLLGKQWLVSDDHEEEEGDEVGHQDNAEKNQDIEIVLDVVNESSSFQDKEGTQKRSRNKKTNKKSDGESSNNTWTKKGIKRKRDVLLKNCEQRPSIVFKNGQQVVRKRDVQLFSRDELVQLPYCPEYHAEEVVLADTQEKTGGRKRRRLKRSGRPSSNRASLVDIRPKVDDPLAIIQPHLLEPFIFGGPDNCHITGSSSVNTFRQTSNKPIIILAGGGSPTKSADIKQLPKLAIKPKASTFLSSSHAGNYRVLKNVDIVVKSDPGLPGIHVPLSTASSLQPGRQLIPEIRTVMAPAVKSTVNGLKVAIPKTGSSLKKKGLMSSSTSLSTIIKPEVETNISPVKDKKSDIIQKKLDSMLKITPSVSYQFDQHTSNNKQDQKRMEENLSAIRMETNANWEIISKDLERCNYPKLKTYIMEKHRWLWQFMKELFDRGDRCVEWKNTHHGIFALNDLERLGQLWENYKILTDQTGKAQCWRQLRYYFGMQDENRIIRQIPLGNGLLYFQFQALFYKERFKQYVYRPYQDFQALEKDIPNISSIIKPMNPDVPTLFCTKGCGSQFRKLEALERHENVCTHVTI